MGKFAEAQLRVINWKLANAESNQESEVEFTDEHLIRLDQIYEAAHEFCQVIMRDPNMEFDQYYVGEITEYAVMLLLQKGTPIYFPSITEDESGKQKIEEYYYPEDVEVTKF